MKRSTLTRGQTIAVSIALIVCVAMTSSYVISHDRASMAAPNWGLTTMVALSGIPIAFGLLLLRRLSLWFVFGIWIGSVLMMPSVPWSEEKRFLIAADHVRAGMPVGEMRQIMRGFHETHDWGLGEVDEHLHLGWEDPGFGVAPKLVQIQAESFTYFVGPVATTPRLDVTVDKGNVIIANFVKEGERSTLPNSLPRLP